MFITIGPDNHTGFRKHLEELSYCFNGQSKFIRIKKRGSEELKNVHLLKPKLTIIGGKNWIIRNYKILNKIPGKKGILFCSPLAQAEISKEEISNLLIYIKWLEEGRIDYLFTGSKDLADTLKRDNVLYLPAPFRKYNLKYDKKYTNRNTIAILNDKMPHKNTANTLAGISKSKLIKEVLINGAEKNWLRLIELFGLKAITKNLGFLSNSEYYEVLNKVKLTTHLSFSEGFCYAALESLYLGTPVLITPTLKWFYNTKLLIRDPEDINEIGDKIDEIFSLSKSDYLELSINCREIAESAIKNNNYACVKTIDSIIKLI